MRIKSRHRKSLLRLEQQYILRRIHTEDTFVTYMSLTEFVSLINPRHLKGCIAYFQQAYRVAVK